MDVGRLLEKASLEGAAGATGVDKDKPEVDILAEDLVLPLLLFLLLMGMLSMPRTSSKLAPMLESKPSAESSSDFALVFGILALLDSSSGRGGL